jgi:hypothetical protein
MKKLKQRLAYSHDSLDPRSLCECLVEDCAEYYASYLPAGVSFDIAACDLAGLEAVQPAVEKLTTVLNALPREAFEDITVLAHWRAQSFKWEQYTDLGDFCEQLRSYAVRVQMAQLQEACDAVIESIRYVITTHRTVGIEFQYARGLSVYFPWSVPAFESPNQLEIYGQLKFPKRSGWLNFLQHYVEATKRPPAEPDSQGRPVIEWPLREVAAGQQRRLVARQLSSAFPSQVSPELRTKVAPDLRTKVAPDLRTKVAPDLRTKVAPDLRTKMAGGVGVGSMKNPPQTVKLAVPLGELIATT